jgi:hypothetical protein
VEIIVIIGRAVIIAHLGRVVMFAHIGRVAVVALIGSVVIVSFISKYSTGPRLLPLQLSRLSQIQSIASLQPKTPLANLKYGTLLTLCNNGKDD